MFVQSLIVEIVVGIRKKPRLYEDNEWQEKKKKTLKNVQFISDFFRFFWLIVFGQPPKKDV